MQRRLRRGGEQEIPIPKPNSGEKQSEFIARCMQFLMGEDPNRDKKQALAIAYSQWRGKEAMSIHPDFQRILGNFLRFFGEADGPQLFLDFISQNGLDPAKAYTPTDQLRESFEWVEPRIEYWKHVEDAKYYKMYMLAANVSMNENDYTNTKDMEYASANLGWRPLDIDHNPEWILPFPASRLEAGNFDSTKKIIEAVIRVADDAVCADTGESVQALIESGEIRHPSIYATPVCGVHTVGNRAVPTCGYEFQRVALLRKEHKLPGDPLSQIFPLPLNEALGGALVEGLNHNTGVSSEMKESSLREVKTLMENQTITQEVESNPEVKQETTEVVSPDTNLVAAEPVVDPCEAKVLAQMEKVADLTKRVADLSDQLAAYQKDVNEKDAKIEALNKIHLEDQTGIAKLEKTNAGNAKREAEHRENLQKANTKVSELTSEIAGLHGQVETQKLDMEVMGKTQEKLGKQVQELERDRGAVKEELAKTKRELNEESVKRAQAAQSEINMAKELSNARSEVSVLTEDKTKQIREISDLTTSNLTKSKDLQRKEQDISELKRKHVELEEAKKDSEAEAKRALEEERAVHIRDVDGMKEAVTASGEKLKRTRKKLFQLADYLKREHGDLVELPEDI